MKSTTWTDDVSFKKYPQLLDDMQTEVLVIGAGITGLLSAYTLAKEGRKVAIVEKNRIASDATYRTTAFLTQSIDTNTSDLIKIYGEKKATHILSSHMSGIEYIESVITAENIECDFERCSNYIYINEPEEFKQLTTEYNASKTLGLDVHLSPTAMKGFTNFGYIELKEQAKFHPLLFLSGLVEKLEAMGVSIYEQTEVCDIEEKENTTTDSETLQIAKTKNEKTIEAKWVIAATYQPFGEPLGLFFKKGMYTSYILEATLPKNTLPQAIYEDMDNPYHYFRIDSLEGEKEDSIIIGGEDHRSDLPVSEKKSFSALQKYVQNLFADNSIVITRKWSGPILEPSDGLALIGPHRNPHVLHAVGFSGNGMTYASIASLILKEIITGKPATHEYSMPELYKASRALDPRSLVYKAKDYTQELLHGAIKNTFRENDQY